MLPRLAEAAWARIAAAPGAPLRSLGAPQSALVGAIADTIIPRTETPGATDVGIQAFVDIIVTENYSDEERATFLAGLDAISAYAKAPASPNVAFALVPPSEREERVRDIESLTDRRVEPARTYWRLKGLVVHGYFTSERVMKDVLHVEVRPGRFDGAAPMPVRHAGSHE